VLYLPDGNHAGQQPPHESGSVAKAIDVVTETVLRRPRDDPSGTTDDGPPGFIARSGDTIGERSAHPRS
jgi:hypothetical protein